MLDKIFGLSYLLLNQGNLLKLVMLYQYKNGF